MLSDEEFGSLGFTFIWKIENFSYSLQRDSVIESPRFVMNFSRCQAAWKLEIYPRELSRREDVISYRLVKEYFYGSGAITLDYELSILAADGSLQESIECEKVEFDIYTSVPGNEKSVAHKVFRQKKNLYLPQDTLTLYCCMWESENVLQWLGQISARTRIGVEKTSIIWPIQNFNTLQLNDIKQIAGPSLKAKTEFLKLYFEPGIHFDANIRIQISQSDTKQDHWTSCRMSVVESNGSLAHTTEDEHFFQEEPGPQIWHFPSTITKSSLMKHKDVYLPNDTLSLQFDFVTSIGVICSELEHSEIGPYASPHVNKFVRNILQKPKVAKFPNSLKEDMKSLYAEKTLCDFSLIAGTDTFTVHKAVLAARSSVFRAMISTDMLEKKTNQVVIPDVDSDTVKRMLKFMYSDTIEDAHWKYVSKLYTAADKYGIQYLKQECSSFMEANMCAENVGEALELGDMYRDNSLKEAAVEFIFRNDDKILHSEEWQKLMKHNSQLVSETMYAMYLKKMGNPNGKYAT